MWREFQASDERREQNHLSSVQNDLMNVFKCDLLNIFKIFRDNIFVADWKIFVLRSP